MQLKSVLLIIILTIPLLASALNYRPLVISLLMVDTHHRNSPDFLVLLEGGSWLYTPTRERLDKAIELYKAHSSTILVCAHQKYKQDIVDFMISNGVQRADLIESQHTYGERGGTYNNVMEIIDVLKRYEHYNSIEIVTSPYHERRVQAIFSNLIAKSGITRPIYIKFRHIENSDIYTTNTYRYLKIVFHEILGLVAYYLQLSPFSCFDSS